MHASNDHDDKKSLLYMFVREEEPWGGKTSLKVFNFFGLTYFQPKNKHINQQNTK